MSKAQVVSELHADARKNFPRRKTQMRGINDTLQIDLVEMIPYAKQNKNYKYILTVIDTFSKFAWAFPIKNKTGIEVTKAMKNVFIATASNLPKNVHSDLGKEFYNKNFKTLMDQHKVNHYSTYSTKKAAIVERFNRTLKHKMWMRFSLQGSYKWLPILQSLVDEYNNSWHRTIKMKPVDVNKTNGQQLLNTVYKNEYVMNAKASEKFKVNDSVRISKYKSIFEKGYTPNWSTEIFTIYKIQRNTQPITYLIKDYENNEIKGAFYAYELQKVKDPNVYLVERILKRSGNKVKVKWLGFNSNHNSWIDKDEIL